MKSSEAKDMAEALFSQRQTPFGAFSLGSDTHQALTIPDAVRRCYWIGIDLNAAEFGLFFVSPSMERSRLVPCFDSDYPKVSTATKYVSGSNGEDLVKHTRASSLPRWWSDGTACASATAFAGLEQTVRTTELVPGNPGIAFPVYGERGQCGLVLFFGRDMTVAGDQLLEIHARCFSLFNAVAMIRPGEFGKIPSISKRELECLKLTAKGFTSEQIATSLKLSVHTANQYLTNTTQKLSAVNRMHAVAKALRIGLIE